MIRTNRIYTNNNYYVPKRAVCNNYTNRNGFISFNCNCNKNSSNNTSSGGFSFLNLFPLITGLAGIGVGLFQLFSASDSLAQITSANDKPADTTPPETPDKKDAPPTTPDNKDVPPASDKDKEPKDIGAKFKAWTIDAIQKSSNGEKVDDFVFVGPEYEKDIKENGGKNAANIYLDSAKKFAQSYIKNVKDLDGKPTTINYEEFKQDELNDYKKAFPDEVIDKEQLQDMDKTNKIKFNIIDKNKDNLIDENEETAFIGIMDQNPKTGDINGKISPNWLSQMSEAGFKKMFNFLFDQS